MKIFNRIAIIISIIIIVILSGCVNKKTPVEKMNGVLEEVVTKEKNFEEQQEPLVTSEKNEKEIYNKIIGLGMKEYNQIVKLSDQAIVSANNRKNYMEKETNSLKESEKEFKKIKSIKGEFDNPDLKRIIDELYEIMMQRYRAHDALYQAYSEGINNDQQLYEMFKNKNVMLNDLQLQVNKINESYKKVNEANENFNKLTEEYNKKKSMFYKKSGLK
ncbi:YkyA family protein [Neobacillus sp. LXY-1]|uniref:YkyA family protein n=1 Tax=Neobacillus sp. LXY-1 TaxID=3379133 RepID=UPI003EE3FBAD